MLAFSGVSFLLGMVLLLRKDFRKSDIAIGISTVAAFVLLLLAGLAIAALSMQM